MSIPRLSVLITVFNGQNYIREAIDSILSQSFSDFELLVADDGSSDSTSVILQMYAQSDARLKFVENDRNVGITKSMNKLFSMAAGDYVTRHDADDISRPGRFDRLVSYLDEHSQIGVLATDVQVIDSAGMFLDIEMFSGGYDDGSIQNELVLRNCLCQGSTIFRRQLIEVVGKYDESLDYTEDYDLWLRMAEVTRMAKLPEKLYCYRRHSESVSFRHYGIQILHTAIALEKAANRRKPTSMAAPDRDLIAETYCRAIELCALAGEPDCVRDGIAGVIRMNPSMLNSDKVMMPFARTESGLRMSEAALKGLPESRILKNWRSRYFSRWHLRHVFEAASTGDWARVDAHIWLGVRHDPNWLFNRGVLAIILKTLKWRYLDGGHDKHSGASSFL